MKTKRNLAIIMATMLVSGAQPASAQGGFFNKLKNKAKEALESVTNVEKKVTNGNTKNRSVGTNDNTSVDDAEISKPQGFENLHLGTIHCDIVEQKGYDVPKVTSSTAYVTVNGQMIDYSNFYDGVAYVYSHEDGCYFIDQNGNRLFDSYVRTSAHMSIPKFNNGVVMEVGHKEKTPTSQEHAFIRDKKGNVIKEFNTSFASKFEEGVAVVAIGQKPTNPKEGYVWVIKFVDTKGNFVYPKLWSSTPTLLALHKEKAIRKSSEGLKAYMVYDKAAQKCLWGFHDGKGNVVIQPKYVEVSDFHEGMAAVCHPATGSGSGAQPHWGYIDKTGREVIPATYTVKPSDFNSGLARVLTRDKDAYIIDKTGKQVFGPVKKASIHSSTSGTPFYISPFCNGYALLGYVAYNERFASTCTFYSVVDTKFNKLAYARLNDGGSSDMDNTFDPLSRNLSFEHVYYSKEDNIFYIQQEHDLSIVDPKTLDLIYNVEFQYPLVNGLSRYNDKNGNYGYINAKGEFVVKFKQSEF